MQCCVCESTEKLAEQFHTRCPSDHKVCVNCYLNILKLCSCTDSCTDSYNGEIIYNCPLCRNCHRFSNIEMYNILTNINPLNNILYIENHKKCKIGNPEEYVFTKCEFQECGCRHNIVNIESDKYITKDILIKVGNHY